MRGLDPSRTRVLSAGANASMSEKSDNGRENRAKRSRQKILGEQLKRIYDDVTHEDIPADFLRLLELADKNKAEGSTR